MTAAETTGETARNLPALNRRRVRAAADHMAAARRLYADAHGAVMLAPDRRRDVVNPAVFMAAADHYRDAARLYRQAGADRYAETAERARHAALADYGAYAARAAYVAGRADR